MSPSSRNLKVYKQKNKASKPKPAFDLEEGEITSPAEKAVVSVPCWLHLLGIAFNLMKLYPECTVLIFLYVYFQVSLIWNMGDSQYSFSLTTFRWSGLHFKVYKFTVKLFNLQWFAMLWLCSPSGKLVQIEHALTAVGSGQTSLGIKGKFFCMCWLRDWSFSYW